MGPTLPSKTNKMELNDKDYSKIPIFSEFGDDGKEHQGFVNTEIVGLTSSGEGGSCTYNIVIKLATYHQYVHTFREFVYKVLINFCSHLVGNAITLAVAVAVVISFLKHLYSLTFRHRASCIQDKRFAALQRTLFIYLINIYNSFSDICLTVHH